MSRARHVTTARGIAAIIRLRTFIRHHFSKGLLLGHTVLAARASSLVRAPRRIPGSP